MVQEAKSPLKNLVRQRCAGGFNSGVKGLSNGASDRKNGWDSVRVKDSTGDLLPPKINPYFRTAKAKQVMVSQNLTSHRGNVTNWTFIPYITLIFSGSGAQTGLWPSRITRFLDHITTRHSR
jgi:hypothetical protein